MKKIFTCIICPNGCEIEAEYQGDKLQNATGALCKQGNEYVEQELRDPRRNIASSIVVYGGELPLVSVRLSGSIPKNEIFNVMAQISKSRVEAPVSIGQVLLPDVCSLGVNVIATKEIKRVN